MNVIEATPRIAPTIYKKRTLPKYKKLGKAPWDGLWPLEVLMCPHRARKTNQSAWNKFEVVPLKKGYQKICHVCKYYYFERG